MPTLPTLVLINNAYIFCNKPNFVTAMTRRTLPSTVLNMAREKKKRAPKSVCYRFHRETETDYEPTLCVQLRISRELHVGLLKKKKEPEALRFNIRGFFFLVIIPCSKAVVRTSLGMDDCAAGGISQHLV